MKKAWGILLTMVMLLAAVTGCGSAKRETSGASGQSALDRVIAEFLDKLEKCGASKYVAEAQRQLDEWLALRK